MDNKIATGDRAVGQAENYPGNEEPEMKNRKRAKVESLVLGYRIMHIITMAALSTTTVRPAKSCIIGTSPWRRSY